MSAQREPAVAARANPKGIETMNVLPSPSLLCTATLPPSCSANSLTRASPIPLPSRLPITRCGDPMKALKNALQLPLRDTDSAVADNQLHPIVLAQPNGNFTRRGVLESI